MKKNQFLSLLAVIIAFASCSKDDTASPSASSTGYLVSQIITTQGESSDTATLTYDSNNKIISFSYGSGTGYSNMVYRNDYSNMVYNSNGTLASFKTFLGGKVYSTTTVIYNGNKITTAVKYTDPSNTNDSIFYTTANNKIISATYAGWNALYNYSYDNDANLKTVAYLSDNKENKDTSAYTYNKSYFNPTNDYSLVLCLLTDDIEKYASKNTFSSEKYTSYIKEGGQWGILGTKTAPYTTVAATENALLPKTVTKQSSTGGTTIITYKYTRKK